MPAFASALYCLALSAAPPRFFRDDDDVALMATPDPLVAREPSSE